jgi:hypothetical protein
MAHFQGVQVRLPEHHRREAADEAREDCGAVYVGFDDQRDVGTCPERLQGPPPDRGRVDTGFNFVAQVAPNMVQHPQVLSAAARYTWGRWPEQACFPSLATGSAPSNDLLLTQLLCQPCCTQAAVKYGVQVCHPLPQGGEPPLHEDMQRIIGEPDPI